jgi:tRNA-splicing ligase RtcB
VPTIINPKLLSWASDIDPETVRQAEKTARLPIVAGHVALMPDAHVGLGATVGSVIPTEGAVIPAAVGVDIGCGMIAAELDVDAAALPDDLGPLLARIEAVIPAGVGKGHDRTAHVASRWLDEHRPATDLSTDQIRKALRQFGTLGSGNHFVEVCLDETDGVWCVLHSGSRGIGNTLATRHIRTAKHLCDRLHRAVEDRDLAYFLEGDVEFGAYIDDLLWSQAYALENRELMMDALLGVLRRQLPVRFRELERINCHHNYAQRERHGDRDLWITRKGAIRAREGDRGIIPGSMGTATYLVTGLGNADSYDSASHGAGRRMGRREAKRQLTTSQLKASMRGRTWQSDKADELLDEAPMAYKDIGQVMADQADLVRVDHELRAVLNYKGTS